MHHTCTNNPIKLTGKFGRFEVRNLSEVFLPAKFRCSSFSSVQIAKTVQCFGFETVENRHAGTWLSRLPFQRGNVKLLKMDAGTSRWSAWISPPIASVFVGSRLAMVLLPPAVSEIGKLTKPKPKIDGSRKWQRKLEVLHLFRWSTHTHTNTSNLVIYPPVVLKTWGPGVDES